MLLKALLVALLVTTPLSCWAGEQEGLPAILGVVLESVIPGAAAGGLLSKLTTTALKKGPSRAQGEVCALDAEVGRLSERLNSVVRELNVERAERRRAEERAGALAARLDGVVLALPSRAAAPSVDAGGAA